MSVGILGNKIGMTQVFDEDGNVVPVTIIRVGPCVVTQIKTVETDGYNAIQLGYCQVPKRKLTKPELGHLSKTNSPALKYLKEFNVHEIEDFSIGQVIEVSEDLIGTSVDVTGRSIGKGFSGNQKRNNFRRGPMTHGSKNHRAPGSIGACATPARVFPGKKMAGQYGNVQTTISNLKVVQVDMSQNLMVLKGSIPGKPGNLLTIKPSLKS